MPSIRKHPRSPFWFACFRDANGSRTTRSTKTADRGKALKMAVEWESAAGRAARGTLTEAQARAVINSILEHAGQDPVVFYTVHDWLTEWLGDKEGSREKTTNEKYTQIIVRFLSHLGSRAKKSLADVRPNDIRTFRDLLRQEGRSASTVNQTIAKVLSAPFAKAVRLGYIPLNPCAAVEPLKTIATEVGVFTLEQVQSLLAIAPGPDWREFILMAYHTGQRMRDMADLTWGQVELSQSMIFLDQSKGNSGVAVPIHPDLEAMLLSRPGGRESNAPIFPTLQGKAGAGKSGLSETFKRIMVRAGITLEKRLEAAGAAGRGRNKLSFHSLRHTLNSVMANAGVAQEVRQKITGHRDADTNKLYTHLDFPALRAAISKVPSVKI